MAFSPKSKLPYLIGAPLAVGLLSTPLWATTPRDLESVRDLVDTTRIELIYPQVAQVGGDEIGGNNSGGDDDQFTPRVTGPAVLVSDAQTAAIVDQLNQIQRICEFMGDDYRISCFVQTYRELAKEIPANGDYAEARSVLLDTAQKLDNLARGSRDRSKPALRARLTTPAGKTVSTPPITAVATARAAQLNQQASSIVAEAETVLLRSASSDARRSIHYQRIAAAVGSNKVLLRSS